MFLLKFPSVNSATLIDLFLKEIFYDTVHVADIALHVDKWWQTVWSWTIHSFHSALSDSIHFLLDEN